MLGMQRDSPIFRRRFLHQMTGAIGAFGGSVFAQNSDALDFLAGHVDFRDARDTVGSALKAAAEKLLAARDANVAKLSSAQDVADRKRYLREKMIRALGGFPERTPLNARTTGTLDREQYRIEKVIFESQPKFYVAANLYLPKASGAPYPAILFPLGHEPGGKSYPAWQTAIVNLAMRGFVVLTWDPLGQGERIQLYDPDLRESKVGASTIEHTVLGSQCLLAGDALARYTIWDGIRALDYLLSRPEVDSGRIGCTGNSGGGTHTAYLAALDDRIHVAAPSCYVTSWRRLLETIGPQDAEQCIPGWIADGLDHGDFIAAFAPKPYLMLSAIRDFFSITGARSTFHEAQRIYEMLGAPGKIEMVEADDGHGYSAPRRVAAYRWFSRWLKGIEDNQPEREIVLASEDELRCTSTGQVNTSLGGETVWSMNRARAGQPSRGAVSEADVARAISFERPHGAPAIQPFGRIQRPGLRIEKLTYATEEGMFVPALLYLPEARGRKGAILTADGRGKSAAAAYANEFARAGLVVLSIDARGFGETRRRLDPSDRAWIRHFDDYETAMTALLLRRTMVGMRATDIVRGVDLLAGHPDVNPERISAFGCEGGAVPLLYAAALEPRIRALALERMVVSYRSIVEHSIHRGVFEQIVPGALKLYDLPALAGLLAPRPVWIVDAADPMGHPADPDAVKVAYSGKAHIRVQRSAPSAAFAQTYGQFLAEAAGNA
jgi:cephalosporin-C deacetylase-like acetyl esterase